ncbi:hypothetical protein OG828_01925 [Streptomyces sp. NBC_00457]|uniref:hypothetical protein n=1 Tax=Streptomyces sp. NBC_00457 TaxID=2975748 RepID=UPI002E1E6109
MVRGRTPWFMVALAALLVALQFFAALTPGTSTHIAHTAAPASPDRFTSVVLDEYADEFATCSDDGQTAEPSPWQPGRDRQRVCTEPDVKPYPLTVRVYDSLALPPSVSHKSGYLASPHTITPCLTSLQVFRC